MTGFWQPQKTWMVARRDPIAKVWRFRGGGPGRMGHRIARSASVAPVRGGKNSRLRSYSEGGTERWKSMPGEATDALAGSL